MLLLYKFKATTNNDKLLPGEIKKWTADTRFQRITVIKKREQTRCGRNGVKLSVKIMTEKARLNLYCRITLCRIFTSKGKYNLIIDDR